MGDAHILAANQDGPPTITPILGDQLAPASLQCMVTFSFPDDGGYTELYSFCPQVQATMISASVSSIIISTMSQSTCNVLVSENLTGSTWLISLSMGSPFKSSIAQYWNCPTNVGSNGYNCTGTAMFKFTTAQMDSAIQAAVINQTTSSYSTTESG